MKLKKILSHIFIISVALIGFLGLISSPVKSNTPSDVLVVGQIAEPKSLDPATVTAVNDFRILMNMYDGLVRYKDGTLEVEPALAKSWTISDDGKTYTFSLRTGISFHDGSKFDANAVKFNFDRMLDENHPYHNTGPFPLSFFFSAIENVEVVVAIYCGSLAEFTTMGIALLKNSVGQRLTFASINKSLAQYI